MVWVTLELSPHRVDLSLGCSRACGEGALVPLAYELGCLPAKTSIAMSILLLLLSTSFKSAVILASFQNQSLSSSVNLEGTIQSGLCMWPTTLWSEIPCV